MLKTLICKSLIILLFVAPVTHAFTVINTEKVVGYVESVDEASRRITLVDYRNNTKEILLGENADIVLFGVRSKNFNDVDAGHKVIFNKKTYTKVNQDISGVIVSINHKRKIAKIRRNQDDKVLTVAFGSAVNVVNESRSKFEFEDLRKGHMITLRAAQALSAVN